MSALFAKQMGIPIPKVICASNLNCIISDFIASGEYDLSIRKLLDSNSPDLDILNSSNLDKFIYHASGGDGNFTAEDKSRRSSWLCSEDDCLRAIREVHATTGYIIDTHTAVGKVVGNRIHDKNCPLVICSTAHHGKFAPAVLKALQCQNIPQDPVKQLDKLCTIGCLEQLHEALLKCMRDSGDHPHKIFQADFNKLADKLSLFCFFFHKSQW
uniref:Threonine synthase-like 1 n=1 Tax=Cyprinus carpio TaxID=7962 RepID=A0A8C1KAV3_CYPCA